MNNGNFIKELLLKIIKIVKTNFNRFYKLKKKATKIFKNLKMKVSHDGMAENTTRSMFNKRLLRALRRYLSGALDLTCVFRMSPLSINDKSFRCSFHFIIDLWENIS